MPFVHTSPKTQSLVLATVITVAVLCSAIVYAEPLLADTRGTTSEELESLYQRGEKAFEQQSYGDAASYLQTILSTNPRFAKALNLLGRIYHHQQKLELAETQYKKALAIDPHFTEARYNLAIAYFDQANYKEAEHLLEEVTAKDHRSEYEYNLGLTYQRLGKVDKGIDAYERAIKTEPNNAFAHYSLARLLQDRGDLDRCIAEYKKAIEIKPDFADAHNNLGVAYSAKGNYEDSVTEFQFALRVNPALPQAQQNLGFAQAHTSLGITYFKQGDYDKSFEEYKRALMIDPGYADAHYNLGLLYQQQGQLETAVAHYQAAIKLDAKNAKPHNNLGVAYEKLGKTDLAEAEFRQALKLTPSYKEAQQNLDSLLSSQARNK